MRLDRFPVQVPAARCRYPRGGDSGVASLKPRSLLIGTHLSGEGGLQRTGVSLARMPSGRASFTHHAHHREAEWIYILAGRAIAEIDGAEHEVGPGALLAFPTPSVAHHLRNPFDEGLVYLMGGENRNVEMADVPRLDRRMVQLNGQVVVYERSSGTPPGETSSEPGD